MISSTDIQNSIASRKQCGCIACSRERDAIEKPTLPTESQFVILCETCGNKRCPHATDHRLACTGSNDPGQDGSIYGTPGKLPPIFRNGSVRPITRVIAIDPGHTKSAYVEYDPQARRVVQFGKLENEELLSRIADSSIADGSLNFSENMMVIEQIASYGMSVGAEIFETVFWSGRFAEAWQDQGGRWDRLKRMVVKMTLCRNSRANDSNIRQALIDLWGGKEKAIGRKATAGPLYGISSDVWAALAVAVTYCETHHLDTGKERLF